MAVLGKVRLISEVPLYTLPPNLQSPTLHTLYTLTSTPRHNLHSRPLDLTALDGEVSVTPCHWGAGIYVAPGERVPGEQHLLDSGQAAAIVRPLTP